MLVFIKVYNVHSNHARWALLIYIKSDDSLYIDAMQAEKVDPRSFSRTACIKGPEYEANDSILSTLCSSRRKKGTK